ncbi:MAG: hypothetical protein ACOZAA_02435 [Pseudomonadota bacterium]
MKLTVLGAASVAAIALVACAKKEEAKTAETVSSAVEAAAPAATEAAAPDVAEVAPEASDVYASAAVDLASLRTKEALTVAADTAFAQADADADGSLSLTEFYSLASIMAPAPAADAAADIVGEVAGEPTAEAAAEAAGEIVAEEPTQDAAALDASFATIAGADAALSTDDLRAAFLSRFDAADANLDGSLDDAEAEAFKAAGLF